jgi:hypothetical protein
MIVSLLVAVVHTWIEQGPCPSAAAAGTGRSRTLTPAAQPLNFAASVPLTLAQLAATVRLDQTTCPVQPSPATSWFIELQGGTKQGSGKPLWFWTFSCNNGLGRPLYLHTNGDPIT